MGVDACLDGWLRLRLVCGRSDRHVDHQHRCQAVDAVTRYRVRFPFGSFVQYCCALLAFVAASLLGTAAAFVFLGFAFWSAVELAHKTRVEAADGL